MSSEHTMASSPDPSDDGLQDLLAFVRDARGFDFTGYKRSTVNRRVHRRMQDLGLDSIAEYQDLLEADVDEFSALFNTVLINVTGFFRDPAAWQYLEAEVLPELVERHDPDELIRLWSAGCASGEEPYGLAMAMANLLGLPEATRRVKIYATDIDLDALETARTAVYSDKALQDVPEGYRQLYFQPDTQNRGSAVIPTLRRTVVFGRHDLTVDPPISRVDLVACRNTLMYLNAETKAAVIPRLHYALGNGGFLFLGRAEMVLGTGVGRFRPVNLKQRIFTAEPQAPQPLFAGDPAAGASSYPERHPFDLQAPIPPPELVDLRSLSDREFEPAIIAELHVNTDLIVTGANDAAQDLLAFDARDLGRPLAELPLAAQPIDLMAPIRQAIAAGSSLGLGVARYMSAAGEAAGRRGAHPAHAGPTPAGGRRQHHVR